MFRALYFVYLGVSILLMIWYYIHEDIISTMVILNWYSILERVAISNINI